MSVQNNITLSVNGSAVNAFGVLPLRRIGVFTSPHERLFPRIATSTIPLIISCTCAICASGPLIDSLASGIKRISGKLDQ